MARFITVTPNPAIDRTYRVGDFTLGDVNRADSVAATAGGKGINVARALSHLGAGAIVTGFAGGLVGEQLVGLLDAEGINHDFVDVTPDETRLAVLIVDPVTGIQTVVNEQGPDLEDTVIDELADVLKDIAAGADGIVFSGSLPLGLSPRHYRNLIESSKKLVPLTLLDATGDMLKECVKAKPTILKINRNEARTLGVIIEDWTARAVSAAQDMSKNLGIEYVALTDGENGAVLVGKGLMVSMHMPKLPVRSAVGSGDSFAAGLINSLAARPEDIPGALRMACACGGANAMTDAPGVFSPEQIGWVSGRIVLG